MSQTGDGCASGLRPPDAVRNNDVMAETHTAAVGELNTTPNTRSRAPVTRRKGWLLRQELACWDSADFWLKSGLGKVFL